MAVDIKTTEESQASSEIAQTNVAPKKALFASIRGSFTWFELLFAAQPTWVDYALILCGTLCAIGAGIPFPLIGILFGQLVDNFNSATCAADGNIAVDPFRYESAINDKVIKTAYIGACAFALIYGHLTCWNIISQRLAQRMRVKYVSALLRQPPSHFDTTQASGQVSGRLNGDIAAIQAGTSEKVGNIIVTLSFFVTVFVIAFTKQPRLAGMLISMLPAFLISGFLGGMFLTKYLVKQNADVASASSIASEALSHVSVVQAFGAAPRLEEKFSLYMKAAKKAGSIKSAIMATQTGLLYFIAYAGNALAFWQGSKLIANSVRSGDDGASVGEIYAVVYLIVDACVMLGGIAPSLPFLAGAAGAYKRLMQDIDAPSSIDGTSAEGTELTYGKSRSIKFRNVSFEYASRPAERVLKNINLDFPAGKFTAIVGLSGSGKSTIAALMARLYDPVEGVVELDGQDIRSINVKSLRSFITFVQQEPCLFDRSILENIALGLVNSSDPAHSKFKQLLDSVDLTEAAAQGKQALKYAASKSTDLAELSNLIKNAAEKADAANFIERLDDGYGTNAGLSGSRMSGGQRQRLALARAMIREPEILVLDEATSALDSASEKRVQLSIEQAAAEKRTIISIAHRLSTIRNADNIIVMKAGEVVEQGSYAELMAIQGGEFVRMAQLQTLNKSGSSDNLNSSASSMNASTLKEDEIINEKAGVLAQHDSLSDDDKTSKKDKDILAAEPKSKEADVVKPFTSVSRGIAWLIRPHLLLTVIAITAAVVVGSVFSASGIIFGFAVGELNPCQNTPDTIEDRGSLYGGMYFLLAAVEFFANFLTWWIFGLIAEKLLFKLRVLSLSSLLEQSIHWHSAEGRTPTSLLAVITNDSMAVSNFSGSTFGTVFAIVVNVVVAIIVSHIFAWKIAIVCLVTLPLLLGSGFMQLRVLARYEEKHKNAFTDAVTLATEAIDSIRTVAVFSLEQEYLDAFKCLLAPPWKSIVRGSATSNIWLAISYSTGIFVNALAYWWGSQRIMRGEYTQRDFLIVLIAMLVSAQLWSGMFALAPEFSRARLAMGRVIGAVNMGSKVNIDKNGRDKARKRDDPEAVLEPKIVGNPLGDSSRGGAKVVFDNVSFSYPGRPDALVMDNVSFKVASNQFCGLVGPSGAGKSTIMNLVQRLYAPTTGSVSIDDQDISRLPTSFRDTVAIVPQDPSLFDGSVKFNVGLGAPPGHEATDAEIEEACKLANIHETIMELPDGYDTECGPGAQRLSGGQKQRLAIARALVRKPRLLLLDESTSALDAASEAALEQGLKRAARNTTVIAITHRLRTVQQADVILVVEDGRIVDSGRHAELMERRESYRLNAMQQMLQ